MNNIPLRFCSLVLLVMLLVGCNAQQAKEIPTVGFIMPSPVLQMVVDGVVARMKELGYVEGQNIKYVSITITSEVPDEILKEVKTFIAQGVDVIVPMTNGVTEASLAATDTIPIVSPFVLYTVELGYADSLTHPGGNFTAVEIGPIIPRRLEFLLEMFPNTKRVYVPYQKGYVTAETSLKVLRPIADKLGVKLVEQGFSTEAEARVGLSSIPDNIDAIFLVPDILVGVVLLSDVDKIAIEHKIPASHLTQPDAGQLFTYGPDLYLNGVQGARLIDEVLKGGAPGNIPVEIGEFTLVFNLQTAKAIGIEIPDAFLSRADKIIR